MIHRTESLGKISNDSGRVPESWLLASDTVESCFSGDHKPLGALAFSSASRSSLPQAQPQNSLLLKSSDVSADKRPRDNGTVLRI